MSVGPSVEAIGEMRILTNGYNAEYGRGAGGVVNVNLKSGHQRGTRDVVRNSAERKAERQPLGEQQSRQRHAAASNRISLAPHAAARS